MARKDRTDYERFEASARHWIERFGLGDWSIHIDHCRFPKQDRSVIARAYTHWTQRTARLAWNDGHVPSKDWTMPSSPEDTALHEVLHIVVASFVHVAIERQDVNADEVDAEEHALIQRLMRVLKSSSTAYTSVTA